MRQHLFKFRLHARNVALIQAYFGVAHSAIFWWTWSRTVSKSASKEARKKAGRPLPKERVLFGSLSMWNPSTTAFHARKLLVGEQKFDHHAWVGEDRDQQGHCQLILVCRHGILLLDRTDAGRIPVTLPLPDPKLHPVREYGPRCIIHGWKAERASIFFMYERDSWGQLWFSRLDLVDFKWTQLMLPSDDIRGIFHPDGSHLLVLDGAPHGLIVHVNDRWHRRSIEELPFAHVYDSRRDRWSSHMVPLVGESLQLRKRYACVSFGSRAFLAIGGEQKQKEYIIAHECTLMRLNSDLTAVESQESYPLLPRGLPNGFLRPVAYRLDDAVYVTHNNSYHDKPLVLRLDMNSRTWSVIPGPETVEHTHPLRLL